ncbi:MAG: hypothetical protein BIFFINMI_03909 [Phycisphaerae bacterium]|nr:hypothetical protein [Phycisphaerae bacterium]
MNAFPGRRLTAALLVAAAGVGLWAAAAHAEEIWLYDNTRVYGLVRGVSADGASLEVLLPTGDKQDVPMEQIIAIRFLGRNPLLVQSGTQEFRFINGGHLRGRILHNDGDIVVVETAMAGVVQIDLAFVKGFVSLPLAGFSGRKAEELVESELGKNSPSLDQVLDHRGSVYPGVVRKLERTELTLDHEVLLQKVPLRILYVKGVRLADAARQPEVPWKGDVQVRLTGRDDSVIQGYLKRVHLGKWYLQPLWDSKAVLKVDVEEISQVQILGGRVQYLSQLTPTAATESTVLAPPQPFRMDQSAQGDPISIAGQRYPWGIGVHADSSLSFDLKGRFKQFQSDIGIASRMADRGSVVYRVLGDGKELYKSPVIQGTGDKPIHVSVPVADVKTLTLEVTNAGDLDLGDVANWGAARVLR